ncbi:MAG: bifunctional homocysteine S-methyltransferase/methylenetetrahydrofolate reductase [Spirochaetales bacterium]|nr:bifunctional homocysteine S-methyltransferase/methylenetetrahydrofolate reductase [Spirochaetales bacterium]
MKLDYRERVKQGIVLFDSAMGTAIYDHGVYLNRCFEEVSLTNPDIILEIHKANVEAGAQVLTTNTFAANPRKLAGHNLGDKIADINLASVKLAKEAAGDDVYVAGSMGPLGVRLEPLGMFSKKEALENFARQAAFLIEGGVDLILLETFRSVTELLLAAEAVKTVSKDIPIQAHFSLTPPSGITEGNALDEYKSGFLKKAISKAVRLDKSELVDVAGCNCGVGPADMLEILNAVREYISKPFAVLPNAGFPKEIDGRQLYLADPDYFSEYSLKFLDGGAAVIGGCCGTNAEHIRKMGKMVLNLDASRKKVEFQQVKEEVKEVEPLPLSQRSKLGKALAAGEWVNSVELIPPMGWNLDKIVERTARLNIPEITCVNLPDGPRASSRISGMITAIELERQTGVETILHVCCRDRNLIGLQSDILGAQAAGLRNMLFVTGDPPKVGNYPDVTGVFDVDAIGLLSLGSRLNHGIDLGGGAIPSPTTMVMGAGINPASPNLELEIERAYGKAEAGAEYFITQPIFDVEAILSFVEKIKDTRVPVLVGVWPLASYRNALFLNNEVPGVTIPDEIMERMEIPEGKEAARIEGVAIARDIIAQVRKDVAGIQISPPFGNVQTALDMIG